MHTVLGFLFGVTHSTVGRVLGRVLPLLEAASRDTMRLPDPGKKHRRTLDAPLADTPDLAALSTPLSRPCNAHVFASRRTRMLSGKKKQHTLKTQVAVDETTGRIVDVTPPYADRPLTSPC